jgi:short-subunit dehydrogenase
MKNEGKKVAIVTGATSGIGLAIAQLLVKRSFSVVLVGRNEDKLKEIRSQLFSGYDVLAVRADVSNPQDVKNIVKATLRIYSKVDVLVNNAAINICGPLQELADEDIEKIIATNFLAPVLLAKEVLPIMISRNNGCIVNVSSLIAFIPRPWMEFYAATKAALKVVTDSWRIEFKPYNIRVIGVYPPRIVGTDFYTRNTTTTPTANKFAYIDKLGIMISVKREEVAKKIVDAISSGFNGDLFINLSTKIAHSIAIHLPSIIKWYLERSHRRLLSSTSTDNIL